MAKVKHYRPPKLVRDHPHTPELEGTSPLRGDLVTHPVHGDGFIARLEWRGPNGEWVPPLERISAWGQWVAVVTTLPTGGYRCPLDTLSRR